LQHILNRGPPASLAFNEMPSGPDASNSFTVASFFAAILFRIPQKQMKCNIQYNISSP
jgi:hypothetical protein